MLFDTHCHLDFENYADDLDQVLAAAKLAGVVRINTIGAGQGAESADAALGIAKKHTDWISCTVGLHPHDAKMWNEPLAAKLQSLADAEEVVAIGETGLDFFYNHSDHREQEHAFRQQIAIAKSVKKPLMIHTRSAAQKTLELLREENAKEVGGIVHCFTEDASFAKQALDLGFVSSFSGIVTFKNAAAIQEAAKQQPADAILIETDAPFLAPIPHRGKRNEPAFIKHTAAFLANLRGEDYEQFCMRTTENACRVFRITSQRL